MVVSPNYHHHVLARLLLCYFLHPITIAVSLDCRHTLAGLAQSCPAICCSPRSLVYRTCGLNISVKRRRSTRTTITLVLVPFLSRCFSCGLVGRAKSEEEGERRWPAGFLGCECGGEFEVVVIICRECGGLSKIGRSGRLLSGQDGI